MDSAVKRRTRRAIPLHVIVFLTPAVIVYTMFMIYPLIDSLRLSLYTQDERRHETFVGLDNYQKLVTSDLWRPRLEGAIKHNLVFFAIHMLVQNPTGLLLAALLSSQFIKGRAIYRTLIFTPTVLSVVLIGFIWSMILSPLWGISGDFFNMIGLPQYAKKPWLGLESTALPTLGLISVWQWVGIPMMLFLAALISIPDELVEAARVDGATAWGVWWRIKFRVFHFDCANQAMHTVLEVIGKVVSRYELEMRWQHSLRRRSPVLLRK